MTRDIYSQRKLIREENQGIRIPIHYYEFETFLTLSFTVGFIDCSEPESNWQYKLKKLFWGSNGETKMEFSVKWENSISDLPQLGEINLKHIIDDLNESNQFDGRVYESGFGSQTIEIYSTRPAKVGVEFSKFIDLTEKAMKSELERLDIELREI